MKDVRFFLLDKTFQAKKRTKVHSAGIEAVFWLPLGQKVGIEDAVFLKA